MTAVRRRQFTKRRFQFAAKLFHYVDSWTLIDRRLSIIDSVAVSVVQ